MIGGRILKSQTMSEKNKQYFTKQDRAGLAFITPSMLVFAVFVFFPMIMSFIYSTETFNMMLTNTKFVGVQNYAKLISDGRFWNALMNTIYYTVCMVPLQVIFALFVGIALQKTSKFNSFVRSVYFLPAICSMTIVAITWSFLINNDFGIYTYWLRRIGIDLPNLLNSTTWAMPTMILIGIWKNLGFKMVVLVAGLVGIPETYYEAAEMDGVTPIMKLFRITIPMLMPTLTFVIVDSVISSFQVFDQVYVMTKGGPLFSTETLVQYIYSNAFEKSNMGYASAIAVMLLIITLLASVPLFNIMKRNESSLN
jgi:multiple sugar transport system permease protein